MISDKEKKLFSDHIIIQFYKKLEVKKKKVKTVQLDALAISYYQQFTSETCEKT